MATADPVYDPSIGGNTPPVTIDGTGLASTVPLLIKTAKTADGVEVQGTSSTISPAYLLNNSAGVTKGAFGLVGTIGDLYTSSVVGFVALTFDSTKGLAIAASGGALVADFGTTGMGVYGNLGFSSAGRLLLSASNSTSSVALQITGDPDTGIGQIGGANTISVVAGSVQSMRVSANNVLIIGDLQFPSTGNIIFDGAGSGGKVGTATTQKIGFWGVTPVVQQILATGAAATVDNVITFLQTIGLCKQA
jgi:hypothetical protein